MYPFYKNVTSIVIESIGNLVYDAGKKKISYNDIYKFVEEKYNYYRSKSRIREIIILLEKKDVLIKYCLKPTEHKKNVIKNPNHKKGRPNKQFTLNPLMISPFEINNKNTIMTLILKKLSESNTDTT